MLLLAQSAGWGMSLLFGVLMLGIAIFLILLILVQRGRGGGLTGALGGMGGQSAFGTKAGDVFTRVTMVTATIWILVCMASIKVLHVRGPLDTTPTRTRVDANAVPGATKGGAQDSGGIKAEAEPSGDAPAGDGAKGDE